MSCECESRSSTRKYARYYDSPDGCDVEIKAMVAARYGALTGLVLGTYDVLMYSNAHGFKNILKRYAFHVVPLSLMGATFALVSNGLLRLRERDDKLNYFLGGFACGPILAAYLGSPHAFFPGAIALGVSAFLKKTTIQNCWEFFPDWEAHYCQANAWRHDYTMAADPRDSMVHSCEDPDVYQ